MCACPEPGAGSSRWKTADVGSLSMSKPQNKWHREPSERSPGGDLETMPFPVGGCLAAKSRPTLLQPYGLLAQVALVVRSLSANAGDVRDPSSIPGWGRSPGGGNTPVFLPGEFHGQRSLVGCSPWGHKESDLTE